MLEPPGHSVQARSRLVGHFGYPRTSVAWPEGPGVTIHCQGVSWDPDHSSRLALHNPLLLTFS